MWKVFDLKNLWTHGDIKTPLIYPVLQRHDRLSTSTPSSPTNSPYPATSREIQLAMQFFSASTTGSTFSDNVVGHSSCQNHQQRMFGKLTALLMVQSSNHLRCMKPHQSRNELPNPNLDCHYLPVFWSKRRESSLFCDQPERQGIDFQLTNPRCVGVT